MTILAVLLFILAIPIIALIGTMIIIHGWPKVSVEITHRHIVDDESKWKLPK